MKSIQKSIRISDEIYEIVNSQPGKGFNEKFENLVISYKRSLPELLEKTKFLNADLDALYKEINEKRVIVSKLRDIECRVNQILHIM